MICSRELLTRNMEIRNLVIHNMEIRNMTIRDTDYPFISKMQNKKMDPNIEDHDPGYQLSRLATLNDTKFFCPIEYIYDYLSPQVNWLKVQPTSLRRVFTAHEEQSKLTFINHQLQDTHSILLDTGGANLPLHTGLEEFRQSRHWKASEKATKELLELFAQDQRCGKVLLQDGQTMASVAEEQLTPEFIHTYSRFPIYLFIEADEDRLKLVAESVILIFAFDGKHDTSWCSRISRPITAPSSLHKLNGNALSLSPDVWESASQKTVNPLHRPALLPQN